MFVVVGVAAVADFTVAFVWVMELASGTINWNLKYINISKLITKYKFSAGIWFCESFNT